MAVTEFCQRDVVHPETIRTGKVRLSSAKLGEDFFSIGLHLD